MSEDGSVGADAEATPRPLVKCQWAVAAPFLDDPTSRWICDAMTSDCHSFVKIPHGVQETSWHTKKASRTGVSEWRAFNATAADLMTTADQVGGGAITVFPQLAAAAGWRKRSRRLEVPLVSWFFNTTFRRDLRSAAARPALGAVDRFVVHSSIEIEAYANHLRIPTDRFVFTHVQYGGEVQTDPIDHDEPFVFATGSGFRDYATLFEAVAKLGVRTKIVAGPRVLAGLEVPSNVEILDVPRHEIHRLVRRATVNVLPMNREGLTAGIITMAEAFRHGRGLIVSDRGGIDDYVTHDDNGLLVPVGDPDSMADAIEAVMGDERLRERLDEAAAVRGDRFHTDEAAAASLHAILDDVLDASTL